MLKKTIKATACVAMLAILFLSLVSCAQPLSIEQGDFSTVINRELPDLQIGEDEEFNVLMLTDTHFLGYGKNDTKTLNAIRESVENNAYDLVVITGDMLEGYNNKAKYDKTKAIQEIANLFEENEQYWAFVAGNNDGEYCGDKKAIFASLVKYEYCLVSDSDVGGVGNYTINIVNQDNTIIHTLIFMDSGMRGEDDKMMAMTAEQIAWYKDIAQLSKTQGIDTSVYMHIPFLEYIDAYKNGTVITSYNNHLSTTDINTHKDNSRLYDAMIEVGNNRLIATGHTHGQDYARYYRDMLWLQVRACGYGVWNDNLPYGGARIKYNFAETNTLGRYNITSINYKR